MTDTNEVDFDSLPKFETFDLEGQYEAVKTPVGEANALSTSQFPSVESLDALHQTFNVALEAYGAANSDVPFPTILGVAFQQMLRFPYFWLTQANNESKFLDYVTTEAKNFLAINEFQKRFADDAAVSGSGD